MEQKYVHSFKDFINESKREEQDSTEIFEKALVITNPEALSAVEDTEAFKNLKVGKEGYQGSEEAVERVAKDLKEKSFKKDKDYMVNEASINETAGLKLEVKEANDDMISILINGHEYKYAESGKGKSGKGEDIPFKEVARKFQKMIQFSAGRALQYLIKNTKLVGGTKKKNKDGSTPGTAVTEELHFENIGHVSVHDIKHGKEWNDEEKDILKKAKLSEHGKTWHNDKEESLLKMGHNHYVFVQESGDGIEYKDADLNMVLSDQGIIVS